MTSINVEVNTTVSLNMESSSACQSSNEQEATSDSEKSGGKDDESAELVHRPSEANTIEESSQLFENTANQKRTMSSVEEHSAEAMDGSDEQQADISSLDNRNVFNSIDEKCTIRDTDNNFVNKLNAEPSDGNECSPDDHRGDPVAPHNHLSKNPEQIAFDQDNNTNQEELKSNASKEFCDRQLASAKSMSMIEPYLALPHQTTAADSATVDTNSVVSETLNTIHTSNNCQQLQGEHLAESTSPKSLSLTSQSQFPQNGDIGDDVDDNDMNDSNDNNNDNSDSVHNGSIIDDSKNRNLHSSFNPLDQQHQQQHDHMTHHEMFSAEKAREHSFSEQQMQIQHQSHPNQLQQHQQHQMQEQYQQFLHPNMAHHQAQQMHHQNQVDMHGQHESSHYKM